jgi:hypothetical protein
LKKKYKPISKMAKKIFEDDEGYWNNLFTEGSKKVYKK